MLRKSLSTNMSEWIGQLFEAECHEQFCKGGKKYPARCLEDGKKKKLKLNFHLCVLEIMKRSLLRSLLIMCLLIKMKSQLILC